jgi:uncharacterized protein (DUF952 family)
VPNHDVIGGVNPIYKICTTAEWREADKLKWEPSRGGSLFPHLYGELPLKVVHRVDPLPLDETGRHAFPRFYC